MKSFYKCECIDKALRARHGDYMHLPYADARSMHASGHVRIVDPDLKLTREIKETDYLYRKSWSRRRMTRVAWCQNYEKNGGAEISNFNAIQVGSQLGFDVVGWQVGGDNSGFELLQSADVVIVNNLHYVETEKNALLQWLYSSGKPFVKYDHDCYGDDQEIYKKAKLNVFISPKHAEYYYNFCGKEISEKSIILPLAFNVDHWKCDGPHEHGTVFIPSYGKCRNGAIEFVQDNPQLRYFVAGDVVPAGSNVTKLGKINYTDMAAEYPKYETVYHCPNEKCAGERIIFEAVMSGCKVITSENAFHTSWGFDWRDQKVLRPILKKAVYEFWAAVEKVLR
jgi:hypothetical protein